MNMENKIKLIAGLYQGRFAINGEKNEASKYYMDNLDLDGILQRLGYENKKAFFESEFYLNALKTHLENDAPNIFYVLFEMDITETEIIMN
jgi:hypothetical protein